MADTNMTPVSKKDLLNEFGVSGTQIINGFIEEDYRTDLQGREGCRIYDEMRRSDAQINATLQAMELPIRQTKWYIEAIGNGEGDIDQKSQEIADFVWKNLFEQMDNTFDDLLREILTMLPFGFSVFEKIYGIKNGKIILKKLGYRKQTTIMKWQMDNGKPGIVQINQNGDDQTEESKKTSNINIPLEKLVIFSFRKEGLNYEGVSVLRSAYKHWYIKDKLYKFDAVRHERQSVGIPIIYMPRIADDTAKSEAKRIVMNIRSTEQTGIVMPGPKEDGWLFEFADTKAGTTTNLFESIKHHNREIAKNILAQFLELGDTQSGSKALSEDQSDLFLLSLGAIANQIRDIFNKYIIPELVNLNFDITDEYYPQLKFQKLGNINYTALVGNLTSLVSSGIIGTDEGLEDYIRETLDLPAKVIDTEINKDLAELDNLEEEINNTEIELDDTGEEQDIEEDQMSDNEEFEDILEGLQFAVVSEEIRQKITEGLKAYWDKKGRKSQNQLKQDIGNESGNVSKARNQIRLQLSNMKDSISEAKNITNKIQRKVAIEKIKNDWKNIKGQLVIQRKASQERIKQAKIEQKNNKEIFKKAKDQYMSKLKSDYNIIKYDKDLEVNKGEIDKVREKISNQYESVKSKLESVKNISDPKRRKEKMITIREDWKKEKEKLSNEKKNLQDKSKSIKEEKTKTTNEYKSKLNQLKTAKDIGGFNEEYICGNGCNHNDDEILNGKYFKDLSELIDQKFIINENLNEE